MLSENPIAITPSTLVGCADRAGHDPVPPAAAAALTLSRPDASEWGLSVAITTCRRCAVTVLLAGPAQPPVGREFRWSAAVGVADLPVVPAGTALSRPVAAPLTPSGYEPGGELVDAASHRPLPPAQSAVRVVAVPGGAAGTAVALAACAECELPVVLLGDGRSWRVGLAVTGAAAPALWHAW